MDQSNCSGKIRVGLSTCHGMSDDLSKSPPRGVEYGFPRALPVQRRLIRSPIKSYLQEFDTQDDYDLLEAVLSPIITDMPWICSLDCFQAALAFRILNVPVPRSLRSAYISQLFRSPNCKRIVFWSKAAYDSMKSYGRVVDQQVLRKATVVYPAMRLPAQTREPTSEVRNLLFSGDFFRKGGLNVLDVFEELQSRLPNLTLRVCSNPETDFNTSNAALRDETLRRLRSNSSVNLGRVPRRQMLDEVLPSTDVYLLPTYGEAFGFAVLEAMSFGVPVIATNVFAIPEIVTAGKDGLLIDVSEFDTEKMFRGYVVNRVPQRFRTHVSSQLKSQLLRLIDSPSLREELSLGALQTCSTKFSVGTRNDCLSTIYTEALL